jgi:hypothetical protein
MTTIAIKKEYAEILANFDDLQQAVNLALQRYMIEQITSKIAELRQKSLVYQTKYGFDYPTFTQRVTEDEHYVEQVESDISKLWELDLAEWEFCYKGIEDWTRKLQTILQV